MVLKIYDILGREVRTLVDEVRPAGLHTISFDASSISSGVYFYRLLGGGLTATGKMMLLR